MTSSAIREWANAGLWRALQSLRDSLILSVKLTPTASTRCLLAPSCEATMSTSCYGDTVLWVFTRDTNYVVFTRPSCQCTWCHRLGAQGRVASCVMGVREEDLIRCLPLVNDILRDEEEYRLPFKSHLELGGRRDLRSWQPWPTLRIRDLLFNWTPNVFEILRNYCWNKYLSATLTLVILPSCSCWMFIQSENKKQAD